MSLLTWLAMGVASVAIMFLVVLAIVSRKIQEARIEALEKEEEERKKRAKEIQLEVSRQQKLEDEKKRYAYDGQSWKEIEGKYNKMVKTHAPQPPKRPQAPPVRNTTISNQDYNDYSSSSYSSGSSSSSSNCSSSSSSYSGSSSSSSDSGGGGCD